MLKTAQIRGTSVSLIEYFRRWRRVNLAGNNQLQISWLVQLQTRGLQPRSNVRSSNEKFICKDDWSSNEKLIFKFNKFIVSVTILCSQIGKEMYKLLNDCINRNIWDWLTFRLKIQVPQILMDRLINFGSNQHKNGIRKRLLLAAWKDRPGVNIQSSE